MTRKAHGSLSYWQVREAGYTNSRSDVPAGPERTTAIRRLVDDGWTYDAIAELYGLSKARVHQLVKPTRS